MNENAKRKVVWSHLALMPVYETPWKSTTNGLAHLLVLVRENGFVETFVIQEDGKIKFIDDTDPML
jgi:hypothetical protein